MQASKLVRGVDSFPTAAGLQVVTVVFNADLPGVAVGIFFQEYDAFRGQGSDLNKVESSTDEGGVDFDLLLEKYFSLAKEGDAGNLTKDAQDKGSAQISAVSNAVLVSNKESVQLLQFLMREIQEPHWESE